MRELSAILFAFMWVTTVTGCRRDESSIVTPQKLSECSARMSIVLPKSARAVQISESRGMDDMILLRVTIPRADLEVFIEQSPFAGSILSAETKQVDVHSGLPWWDIGDVMSFRSGETQLQDGSYLRVLIGLDDPATATLYLEWFET